MRHARWPIRRAISGVLCALLVTGLSFGPGAGLTKGLENGPADPDCTETRPTARTIVLDCQPGFVAPHDIVTIYLRSASSAPTSDAVWLFEVGGKRAGLIIDFHHSQTGPVADLYDDRNGDRTVDYVLVDGVPLPLESEYPTVRVTSRDGWWTRDGRTSFNLDIVVDGPVRATFGAALGVPGAYTHLSHDGHRDYNIQVRDRDGNGAPELEWRQFYPPFPESPALSSHYRTEIASNPEDDEVAISGSFLWPYLALQPGTVGQYAKDYQSSPPPIQVDWSNGRIIKVSEFVASRGNPGSFFIYSINRVREGSTTATNFESPFAFYDLAGADDGWPDTSIRFVALLPGELRDVPNTDPINIVTYTWDQHHTHNWTYSLNLVGRQRVEQTIDFGDFAVQAIPPDGLPEWVSDQLWNAATFVEVNQEPYWTSERVYEYTPEFDSAVLPYRYLTGLTDVAPTKTFEQIKPGFRGEYSFHLDGPARLYVNPVDRRLHLFGATSGVWNMGDDGELRYGNLGGPYIDHWTSRDSDGHTEELYWAADQLIYVSATEVRIGRISGTEEPELISPPANHDEWASLGSLLDVEQPPFAPSDLRAMFDRSATSVRRLPGAAATGFRLTDRGFRFIFTPLAVSDGIPVGPSRGAPQQLVRYDPDDGYTWTTARPAALEVSPIGVAGGSAQASAVSELQFSVRNAGDLDAVGVRLTLEAAPVGAPSQDIGSIVLDVPGGGSSEGRLSWAPTSAGRWLIVPQVTGSAGAQSATLLKVGNAPETSLPAVMRVDAIPAGLYVLAILALAGGALLAGEIIGFERPRRSRPVRSGRSIQPTDG